MAHEDIEYVTPPEGNSPTGDDDEILRGLEKRLEESLAGVRQARRGIQRLTAAERSDAIRELARLTGDSGDAQHVVRHALEALAAQVGDVAPTRSDLEVSRPRLRFSPIRLGTFLAGAGMIAAGCLIHSDARGQDLIVAGVATVMGSLGLSYRRRSG
jgi:hypothetical protein